jgi:hypothetical protein
MMTDHGVSPAIIQLLRLLLIRHAIPKDPVNRNELRMSNSRCCALWTTTRLQSVMAISK